jgi:bifunctional non-homologous end joining protein LigD
VLEIKDGRTNLSELQAALAGGRQGHIEYYVFDLLYLDGYDIRLPQIERKRLLKELFDKHALQPPLHYSGIVSKNPAAPYRSDRNEGWLKIKTMQRGTFAWLTKAIRKPKATWVEPSFVADVEYRDITSEGLLRQSSFKGLTRRN